MKDKLLTLEVQSPEELEAAITKAVSEAQEEIKFADLYVSGTDVLVSHFSLPNLSSKQLQKTLHLEAVGLLSLNPKDIEFDYQVLNKTKDKISGMYVAIPKKVLSGYILRLEKQNLSPLSITASILSRIDYFLRNNITEGGAFCLLDFYKDSAVNLSLFNQGQCEFLREIRYEDIRDAQDEITRTLKFASGKTDCKEIEAFYAMGDIVNKGKLLSNLEAELSKQIKRCGPVDLSQEQDLGFPKPYFKINLVKKYSLPLDLRKKIISTTDILAVACACIFLIMGLRVIIQFIQIKRATSSIPLSDFEKARDLKKQLEFLKNAK